jgi:hypothetical protein
MSLANDERRLEYCAEYKSDGRLILIGALARMKTVSSPELLKALHREQLRLRLGLAGFLLLTVIVFALAMSWLGQHDPLEPLLRVKLSLFGLLAVYAVGIGATAVYSRWIRMRREPAVRALIASNSNEEHSLWKRS